MKNIVTLILLCNLIIPANCQKSKVVRVFDYLTPYDNWQVKVFNNTQFYLTSNNLFGQNETLFNGYLQTGDSTIKFICDTSKVDNRNLIRDGLKQFSNIPFIAQGEIFKKAGHYFIPNNIIYRLSDSIEIPKGIYATYYRGDGFGNYLLCLKKDGTYKFTDHSCMMNFYEEGRWTKQHDVIMLHPLKKNITTANSITDNNQFYITDNFLIGKKTENTNKDTTTETYYYLAKSDIKND